MSHSHVPEVFWGSETFPDQLSTTRTTTREQGNKGTRGQPQGQYSWPAASDRCLPQLNPPIPADHTETQNASSGIFHFTSLTKTMPEHTGVRNTSHKMLNMVCHLSSISLGLFQILGLVKFWSTDLTQVISTLPGVTVSCNVTCLTELEYQSGRFCLKIIILHSNTNFLSLSVAGHTVETQYSTAVKCSVYF